MEMLMRLAPALFLLCLALSTPVFALDPAVVRNMKVTEQDEQILLRAEELLKDENKWNRQDERWCVDDEKTNKRSLFCALHQATVEVVGKYEHRQAALEYVRLVIMELTPNADYGHRLMDYNNDPTTTHADIQRVLDMALAEVRSKMAEKGLP
jgi:hypothetical protein